MTKRIADNVNASESAEKKLADLKTQNAAEYAKLTAALGDSHPSLTTFFDFYRSANWIELLQDGEAMGVTLAMRQRALGIVAPVGLGPLSFALLCAALLPGSFDSGSDGPSIFVPRLMCVIIGYDQNR